MHARQRVYKDGRMNKDVTGLVLAGGRGTRMGGVDKGLERFQGEPLAVRAMMRLMPQVGEVMVNANRNLGVYEGFGCEVLLDSIEGFQGPLAGILAGLAAIQTRFMQVVPCDVPNYPLNITDKLYKAAVAADAPIAMPYTIEPDGRRQVHPVFVLVRADMHDPLFEYLRAGHRKIDPWTKQMGAVEVEFSDTPAFFNANTTAELRELEGR